MKCKSKLNVKRKLVIIFAFIIINIFIYNLYQYYTDKVFITDCIALCWKDIYNYFIQEDSRIFFGIYNVHIGTEKKQLLSSYYNDYIINKEFIRLYLISLDWNDIILRNNKNMSQIIIDVRLGFIENIRIQEQEYTFNLLQRINISETKKMITIILQNYGKDLALSSLVISNEFIMNILNDIDWNLYVRTVEFNNKTFETILDFYFNKTQSIKNSSLTNSYLFLRNIIAIGAVLKTILYVNNFYLLFKEISTFKGIFNIATKTYFIAFYGKIRDDEQILTMFVGMLEKLKSFF